MEDKITKQTNKEKKKRKKYLCMLNTHLHIDLQATYNKFITFNLKYTSISLLKQYLLFFIYFVLFSVYRKEKFRTLLIEGQTKKAIQ